MTELLSGGGAGNNLEGAYILKEYVGSWESYSLANKQNGLSNLFAMGDAIGRFGGVTTLFSTSDVSLWRYYQRMVNADVDQKSGIVDIDVHAYTAQDAHKLASTVLANAIARMDVMNDAQEHDAVRVAFSRKTQMEQALTQDENTLAAYRSRQGIFDPDARYTADLQLTGGLALQEAQIAAQQSAGKQAMADNPNVAALNASMAALRARAKQAGADGPDLARKAAVYNQLVIHRDSDAALLKAASLAVQEAELKSTDGRYYLSVISQPSMPRSPQLPNRIEWISAVFLASLLLWALLR